MYSHGVDDVLDPVLQQFYSSSSSCHSSSVLKVPIKFGVPCLASLIPCSRFAQNKGSIEGHAFANSLCTCVMF